MNRGFVPVQESAEIGMSPGDVKRFSLVRMLQAQIMGKPEHAAFEFECSDAVSARLRKKPMGCFVPYDVTHVRDLTKGTATAGGYTVATDLLAASFIELLRNRMVVKQLGARVLSGLVGDVAIPRQTGGATAYWTAEGVAPTVSQPAIGQVAMVPKTVGAYTDFTRKLLMQSSVGIEAFVRGDLAATLALAIDLAAINGAGAAGEPLGVLNTTGIGSVVGGTNGAAPDFADIIGLESEVANDNADVGSLAYLTNSKVRGALKATEKATNTGQFVWENNPLRPGTGLLNGYPALVSNQVPSDLVKGASSTCSAILFGNWADLIIGEWGALDVLVDPYTNGAAGTVRVRVLQDVDVAVRHPESFAAMLDALC